MIFRWLQKFFSSREAQTTTNFNDFWRFKIFCWLRLEIWSFGIYTFNFWWFLNKTWHPLLTIPDLILRRRLYRKKPEVKVSRRAYVRWLHVFVFTRFELVWEFPENMWDSIKRRLDSKESIGDLEEPETRESALGRSKIIKNNLNSTGNFLNFNDLKILKFLLHFANLLIAIISGWTYLFTTVVGICSNRNNL